MDPHNFQASIASNDYFNGGGRGGLELAIPQQLSHPIQPGPRSYKSRKYRPCDFCRARQVRCAISSAPPCELCMSHGRSCTFVDRPKKKRRPNLTASNDDQSSGSTTSTCMSQHYTMEFTRFLEKSFADLVSVELLLPCNNMMSPPRNLVPVSSHNIVNTTFRA